MSEKFAIIWKSLLASANTRVFKEPRGFMKILQFIFGICAFATTTSFTANYEIEVGCNKTTTNLTTIKTTLYYPFRLDHLSGEYDACGEKPTFLLMGDFSSDAGFYVTVGVLAFLYSITALGAYVFLGPIYENNSNIPLGDCAMHVVFAILFLAGSSAWANSLSSMRSALEFKFITDINNGDKEGDGDLCKSPFVCYEGHVINFSKLVISLILGFLNVFLWASNLWFLYKETPHFKARSGNGDGMVAQEGVGGTA